MRPIGGFVESADEEVRRCYRLEVQQSSDYVRTRCGCAITPRKDRQMPRFNVAHIHRDGQDMIIFPLDGNFGLRSHVDQSAAVNELELRARAAGLAGTAVAVWESGNRTYFLGPKLWYPFLESIDLAWVWEHVNKEISWSD